MKDFLRELYGAGILFFFYMKWPIIIGYPVLVFFMDYQRHWSLDTLWIYCMVLAVKDIVYRYILKRRYCGENGSCNNEK